MVLSLEKKKNLFFVARQKERENDEQMGS